MNRLYPLPSARLEGPPSMRNYFMKRIWLFVQVSFTLHSFLVWQHSLHSSVV